MEQKWQETTFRLPTTFLNLIDYLASSSRTHGVQMNRDDIAQAAFSFFFSRYLDDPHVAPALYEEIRKDLDQHFSLGSMYPLKNSIAHYIKNVRKINLAQKEIAQQLGISPSTLSMILKNVNQPSLDVFLRIWIWLGVPPLKELLYREMPEEKK
ncbi:helix-turn-helix domain-containing protein [Brevibacillus massiliensis]|jgi:DNA-binding XRE family transcriptional regulator|uniref:helix-turn-helix domain-containing protein n=1 Tax=Brevibacillus massiliensis TaxID=1118054 RepID=UPI0002F1FDD6|nr:helix-turn-helix transcriptional regulator [Brevibacillus massiliensis]